MAKESNYLGKTKKGIKADFFVSTVFVLLVLTAYFRYDSFSTIPLIFKIILAISGICAVAIRFYTKYHLLVCPFCHKPFEGSLKHRLSGTKAIPHRCPNCGVVIDYTANNI